MNNLNRTHTIYRFHTQKLMSEETDLRRLFDDVVIDAPDGVTITGTCDADGDASVEAKRDLGDGLSSSFVLSDSGNVETSLLELLDAVDAGVPDGLVVQLVVDKRGEAVVEVIEEQEVLTWYGAVMKRQAASA